MRLLILLILSLNIYAQDIVQFKFSKSHGVFEFFKATSGIANSNTMLKDLYEKSAEKNKNNDEIIKQSQIILDFLNVNYSFNSNVKTRKSGQSLEKQFTVQSILADNLEEFKSRTTGLIPIQIHKKFFDQLKEIETIYEKVIWKNSLAKMEIYKRNIQQMANKIKIDELFKNAVKFYKGNWPDKTPFIIGLHPIPAIQGTTRAESLGAVESVSVLLDANDFKDRIGVIFHEICHSLYSSQSEKFKLEIEKIFKSSESEYAPYAYHFFNETLATSLGNGLAYFKAAGSKDRGQWYNNEYIDKMAKSIYEKAKLYLNSQKPIDFYFIEYTIKQFEQLFPKANKDYENLLNEFLLITDNKKDARGYINTVRKSFRSNSIYHYDPINSSSAIGGLQSHLPGTVMIVVKNGQESSFQQMSLDFPQLRRLVPLMMKSKKSYILSTHDPKTGSTVIIKTNEDDDFQKAILKLKELRYVPEKTKQIIL